VKLATLVQLCGSEMLRGHFKVELKKALGLLARPVSWKHGSSRRPGGGQEEVLTFDRPGIDF